MRNCALEFDAEPVIGRRESADPLAPRRNDDEAKIPPPRPTLILRRAGPWWRREKVAPLMAAASA